MPIELTHWRREGREEKMATEFKIGDRVFKWTGDYTGPGTVRGISKLPSGKTRYLVGHSIVGGTGEFLHVYASGNLRLENSIGDQS